MIRISPKVIDVEGNRVKIIGVDDRSAGMRTCNFGDEIKISGGIDSPEYIPNENGRFPTQLFTNIKNDKYKYVKFILDK